MDFTSPELSWSIRLDHCLQVENYVYLLVIFFQVQLLSGETECWEISIIRFILKRTQYSESKMMLIRGNSVNFVQN